MPDGAAQTRNGKCCHADSLADLPAMRRRKKRGSNRSWSLMIGPKPNRKWGREQGRRRCALPLNLDRGRRIRSRFGVAIRGPKGGGDRSAPQQRVLYELYRTDRQYQERHASHAHSHGLKKNVAPLEGRAEPQSCRNEFPQGGNAGCVREEETHRCDEWAYRPRASAQQPGR